MSWVRRMGWLPPCHCRGNGPLQQSPTKTALVQNRDPAWIPAQKDFLGQESNTKCAESPRLQSRGLGSGLPWPFVPAGRVSCGLCSLGRGPRQRHQGQGRALRSFQQPRSQLSKEQKITPITTHQILKMENHTLGKMWAATMIGKIELIIFMWEIHPNPIFKKSITLLN